MAIPKGQGEPATPSMSHRQVFFRIQVPQMIRLAIPGFTNNWCAGGRHRADFRGRPRT